ncbi:hypothetical protein IFM89_036101 [Coptis chinensis]|uniref:DUF4005 domain-containing protein n=1 Tax=Coptis chinensis TaxID=261450 RepID=A0A835J060_9MAGN|nr:hypothetical protein IFM89_036101 [Coptis chinensis]
MGKSPGKWIKTVLFGKKASRSNSSKGKDALKSSNEKEVLVSAKTPTVGLVVSSPMISQPEPVANCTTGNNSDLHQGAASTITHEGVVSVPGDQGEDRKGSIRLNALDGPEKIRQDQAVTKVQAAFRGYLARRAFRALMGIIRLQALIRGHLVRRQAVATLRCLQGIIKFQAVVRGKKVDTKRTCSRGLHTLTNAEELLRNSFISKLLASSSNAKPLRLQYGLVESNSAWSWLERWTNSRVSEPLPPPKKVVSSKSHTRPKRSVRKVPAASVENGSTHSTSTSERPKRNMRKIVVHSVDMVQEGSQNELEKVKRNLRKISNSKDEVTDHYEAEVEKPKRIPRRSSGSPAPNVSEAGMGELAETEKPKHNHRKVSSSKTETADTEGTQSEKQKCISGNLLGLPAPDVQDHGMVESAEMMTNVTLVPVSKDLEECTPKQFPENGMLELLNSDNPTFDSLPFESCEKDESTPVTSDKVTLKDDQASNESQSRRRSSLLVKQDYPDTGLQNTPKLPSYMAATESAKAKLRAQGSPRSGPDVNEQNGLTRRLSLPSPTNGKLSSLSPRTHRPQGNGKGQVKNERSILSSKDGNGKTS